jgi:hypothetical protein
MIRFALSLILTLLLAPAAVAVPSPHPPPKRQICGGYQSEDFGDRVIYMLTDFRGTTPVYYSIQNPAVETGLTLIRGLCYCVEGEALNDLEFDGDANYKVLYLNKIVSGPKVGCWPK